jgi:RNA polymerase sigma factor (TIGR02999 family)
MSRSVVSHSAPICATKNGGSTRASGVRQNLTTGGRQAHWLVQSPVMTDVTKILSQIESGDPSAAEQLLPLVYDELRRLAAAKLAREKPEQTLQATALVHEAYLRLVDVEQAQHWNSRGHFFAAAAEAMRRILVENARRKRSLKRGGDIERRTLLTAEIAAPEIKHDVLSVNEALDRLTETDEQAATLVKLRYFIGLTVEESAQALGLSTRSTERLWTWAKAWLFSSLRSDQEDSP